MSIANLILMRRLTDTENVFKAINLDLLLIDVHGAVEQNGFPQWRRRHSKTQLSAGWGGEGASLSRLLLQRRDAIKRDKGVKSWRTAAFAVWKRVFLEV